MDHTAAAKDFRQFIKELNDEGELVTITKEVDPDLELGAIVRRVYETGERAPLFVNPKGRNDDGLFRMLGAPFGTSKRPGLQLCRIAKALGLPSSATAKQIVERINEAKEKPPIPCNQLKTSPIKEHILRGDEIDLTQLPAPMLHEDDGGKYLDTLGMHVVQSPDGKWTNWSITRGMIIGKREMTGPVILRQDIGAIWSMWKEKGEDMPWALAFGVPPAAIMVSGMPLPKWTNESEYIGALTGAPVDVVKCESNNLWVPANAEIVFEGVVSISETSPEGPMVEYNGMIFPGEKHPWPVFKVNTITYRKDPILPVCVAGRAPDETHTIWNTMQA
jgi:4-hydroxy-3-polyprenylbenzoate decarboxylase